MVFLQAPLLPSTRHMLNEDVLPKLKKGMTLINTSRGGERASRLNRLKPGGRKVEACFVFRALGSKNSARLSTNRIPGAKQNMVCVVVCCMRVATIVFFEDFVFLHPVGGAFLLIKK